MIHIRKLLLILPLLGCLASCRKAVEKKDIVIMASYENGTQMWQNYAAIARKEFSDTSKYNVRVYYVYEHTFSKEYERDYSRELARVLNYVKREVAHPDIIILQGDYLSHAAARLDDPLIKNTPLLCTGVVDPGWNNLLPSMPNVVVMESRPEVRKNLDFIQELGFSNYVVTVMDSTYVDDRIRERILEEIGNDTEHYRPNLHLEQEDRIYDKDARDRRITLFPVSIMWPEKNDRHPGDPGAFELDWIFNTNQQETAFLHIKEDMYSNVAMSYNIGAYLTMTPEHFNLPLINGLSYCLGGYFTTWQSMWKQLHPIVDKLLDGTDPKQIPWGTLKKDYWLDWRLAKSIRPYASDFPDYVNFVNLPWQERSRALNIFVFLLILLLILAFIVFAVIVPSILSARQKRQMKLLYEKATEAEHTKSQVEYIISQLNAYIWRMLPDRKLLFSPSFYKDFNIPADKAIEYENILEYMEEPGRSQLRDLLAQDFFPETELEIVMNIPGHKEPSALLLHLMCLSDAGAGKESEYHLKAGFFYFNDEAYKRNEEMRQAYRRNEEISKKEQFLVSMNEEFLKPVDKILFFAGMLANNFNEMSDTQKSDCEQELMKANGRLTSLLSRVMGDTELNNIEKIELSYLNVSKLLEEIYMSHSVVKDPGSQLIFSPGPADCEIWANRPLLLQIMDSLISDAFAMDQGDITIGWRENKKIGVVIFILNSGADISKCDRMIESVGANVEVFSVPGSPACIEITFPATPPFISMIKDDNVLRK